MCLTDPFKLGQSRRCIWNSSYCHHQIGNINLSYCCHIFSVVVCPRLYHHNLSVASYRSRESCALFPLPLCTMGWRSHSFVFAPHYFNIIVMQTDLKALNIWNACRRYFVESVSKINSIISIMFFAMYGFFSAYAFRFWWLYVFVLVLEYLYFTLLSSPSNRKNESLAVV